MTYGYKNPTRADFRKGGRNLRKHRQQFLKVSPQEKVGEVLVDKKEGAQDSV